MLLPQHHSLASPPHAAKRQKTQSGAARHLQYSSSRSGSMQQRVKLLQASSGDAAGSSNGSSQDGSGLQPSPPANPTSQQQQQQQQLSPQQQQQQLTPQQPPDQKVQLTPALAAKLVAAAAAAQRPAASLTPLDMTVISCAWAPLLPRTMGDCNKLLSARLKAALPEDPLGFELMKQDGKDFMTGVIPAPEFAERFFAIFASTPGNIQHELFMQLALLVPQPAKRLELLQNALNPWVLPDGPVTAESITAALQQQQQQQQPPVAQQAAAAAAAAVADDPGEDELADGEDEYEDEDEYEVDDEDEYEDEYELANEAAEDEEAEDDDGSDRSAPQQRPAAVDLLAPEDIRELKGWQPVDRTRLQQLAAGLVVPSSAELAAAAAARRPQGRKQALAGMQLDTGVADNSASSRPAKKTAVKKSLAAAAASGTAAAAPSQPAVNAIMWFRQDLRIHDNPALVEAAKWAQRRGGSVVCVYVHSPAEDEDVVGHGSSWRPGGASLLWVECALQSLSTDLVSRYGPGASIVYKHGPYAQALNEVATALKAGAVFYNSRYEPAMCTTDVCVAAQLSAAGLAVQPSAGLLLQEPWNVKLNMSKWHGHFGTLMPFYRAWSAVKAPDRPLPEPQQLPVAKPSLKTEAQGVPLQALGLYKPPKRRAAATPARLLTEQQQQQLQQQDSSDVVDWGATIRSTWDISERGALQLLSTFLTSSTGLSAYESARSFADGRSVSKLSPYLHFGQLSARLMWQRMKVAKAQDVSKTFFRRLVWRDLAYWQLYHWPNMAVEPVRPGYSDMQWAQGPEADAALKAWQQGQTGFPLVDAGMRELWATGWMQQSVRMVAAAFLTEYLNLPWTAGAAWFHDCLIDADLAINSMMWQNAGKSGLDQWNFTLLPTSRSQDPTGAYIKRWVPELAGLPPAHIHTPWTAPAADLEAAGVVLGHNYPHRIVTHELSQLRAANVAAIRAARAAGIASGALTADSRGYDMVPAPEGSTLKHDGSPVVLFTKQEYRQLQGPIPPPALTAGSTPVDEGEEAAEDEHAGSGWARRQTKRQKAAAGSKGGGGKAARRPQRGRGGQQPGQRTLEEVVGRMTKG